jgi:RNA polymerase sigma-70 factor (family 1)
MGVVNDMDMQLLLQQLQSGDEQAFYTLYHLHSKMLYVDILHIIKDREVAKELLQDLYLKIWERRRELDPERSFKSYLFIVARNIVYDYLRRVALDKKLKIRLMKSVIESYTHSEEAVDFKESTELVMTAIETLPTQRRKIYILCKVEGQSHEEISKELGISISTVNNHMVRANKKVRDYFLRNSDLAIIYFLGAILSRFS